VVDVVLVVVVDEFELLVVVVVTVVLDPELVLVVDELESSTITIAFDVSSLAAEAEAECRDVEAVEDPTFPSILGEFEQF
jgi:hypothetical protein